LDAGIRFSRAVFEDGPEGVHDRELGDDRLVAFITAILTDPGPKRRSGQSVLSGFANSVSDVMSAFWA